MTFQRAIDNLYRKAATEPISSLCCIAQPLTQMPDLSIPQIMLDMNYGCGTSAQLGRLSREDKIAYIGVGGGLELLQLAWMIRTPGSVIGIDRLPEMLKRAVENLELATLENSWFDNSMISLLEGDALALPFADESLTVVAQNCVFNMFAFNEFNKAIGEAYRVLEDGGRLMISDPVSSVAIPEKLRQNGELRALCLSGALPLNEYIEVLTKVGFGQIEVHRRRPYRVLAACDYDLEEDILLYSIELTAYKVEADQDGPCVFTGRTATYVGNEETFSDGKGHVMVRGVPLDVCDKTAAAVSRFGSQVILTEPTWHYAGGGCC